MGLLAGEDSHGYDLKQQHDLTFAGAKPLAFGQVYATLERLAKKEFVAPVEVEQVDGPERTIYGLTAAGRAELERWLGDIQPPAPPVANPFAVKATIAMLVGDVADARRYLSAQRSAHLDRMRFFTRRKTDPAVTLADALAADYAIFHLDADLAWLDAALERVDALIPASQQADELDPTSTTRPSTTRTPT